MFLLNATIHCFVADANKKNRKRFWGFAFKQRQVLCVLHKRWLIVGRGAFCLFYYYFCSMIRELGNSSINHHIAILEHSYIVVSHWCSEAGWGGAVSSFYPQVTFPTRQCRLLESSLGSRVCSATSTIPVSSTPPRENPQALYLTTRIPCELAFSTLKLCWGAFRHWPFHCYFPQNIAALQYIDVCLTVYCPFCSDSGAHRRYGSVPFSDSRWASPHFDFRCSDWPASMGTSKSFFSVTRTSSRWEGCGMSWP